MKPYATLKSELDGVEKELKNNMNMLYMELKLINKRLIDENIQLREKLVHFYQLKNDVEYLEEKGVF